MGNDRHRRMGKMAIFEKLARVLFGRVFPSVDRCPVCGGSEVTSSIRRSRIVVDGPMYMEMKCGKCGHKWRLLLRTGP